MIEVGDKIRFVPGAWQNFSYDEHSVMETYGADKDVLGTVIEVNVPHRWYRVEYETRGGKQHETFKF